MCTTNWNYDINRYNGENLFLLYGKRFHLIRILERKDDYFMLTRNYYMLMETMKSLKIFIDSFFFFFSTYADPRYKFYVDYYLVNMHEQETIQLKAEFVSITRNTRDIYRFLIFIDKRKKQLYLNV